MSCLSSTHLGMCVLAYALLVHADVAARAAVNSRPLARSSLIIADGTFESLKQHHNDTLERIFSKLTGNEDTGSETDAIINAFD